MVRRSSFADWLGSKGWPSFDGRLCLERCLGLSGGLGAAVCLSMLASRTALAQTSVEPGNAEATSAEPANAEPSSAEPGTVEPVTVERSIVAPPVEARDLSVQRPIAKPWQVLGEVQYRALVVRDEDPANDQRMLYRLGYSYALRPELILAARGGVSQRFVSEEDESGFRLDDTALSASYQHEVDLARLGWDRSLGLVHRLRVYLPTSRRSQQDDLYFAAEWMTRARVRVTDQLFTGLRGVLQYHAHGYAEQSGPGGEALPRVVVEALAFLEYSPLVSPSLGTLTVGADVYSDQTIDYPSRDPGQISADELPPGTLADRTDTLVGAGSTDIFSSPHFGYDLYVVYQPPFEHLQFMASLEQVGNAVRYGESRLFLFNRDETEFALRVMVTY
jgi:hypothetical protein